MDKDKYIEQLEIDNLKLVEEVQSLKDELAKVNVINDALVKTKIETNTDIDDLVKVQLEHKTRCLEEALQAIADETAIEPEKFVGLGAGAIGAKGGQGTVPSEQYINNAYGLKRRNN